MSDRQTDKQTRLLMHSPVTADAQAYLNCMCHYTTHGTRHSFATVLRTTRYTVDDDDDDDGDGDDDNETCLEACTPTMLRN